MNAADRFARRVFLGAGTLGVLVLAPNYFLEDRLGADFPPAITHPEYFYGFLGVALAWQIAILMIGRDPRRLRPVIPAAVAEKILFAAPTFVLVASGRAHPMNAVFAAIDVVLAALFVVAYVRLREPAPVGAG